MDAELIKQKLQQLGWGTEPTDLVRCYYAMLLTSRTRNKHLEKRPTLRNCEVYHSLLLNGKFSGFRCEFMDFNIYGEKTDLFDELTGEIVSHMLPEFIEAMAPGRIRNAKFFDLLQKQYENPFFQCLCLYYLLCIPADQEPDEAWEEYRQLSSEQKEPLTKDMFRKLFCLMNWQEARDETSLKAAAKEVNKLLTESIIPNEKKCEIVAEILHRQARLKDKDIVAPAAYLSKILSGDSKVFQTADAAEKIEKIIKQVTKSISFLDFLAVLMNESGKAENLADCGFLLPWLKTEWADSGYASCLVNAAPAFFSAWGPGKADCITVPYASAKDPVSEFIEASVYSMDELETIPYFGKQRVLYFAHGYSETETRWHLLALCRDHALVYAVLPDIYKDVSVGIPGYSVSGITILPTELFKGSVSKHFVAVLTPEEHKAIAARTVVLETIERRSYCAPESLWAATTVNAEDYAAQQTVRALFRQALTKKENVKAYSRPQAYAFSPELTLWYSGTTNESGNRRICLYLCEVPTDQQRKRNQYPRGAKIVSTETWNTDIPEEQIGFWIEHRGAYNEKLRSKAVEQLERYKGRAMSLKSLWYCLCDRTPFSPEEEWRIDSLLQTETVSGLMIGAVSEEEIEAAVAAAGADPDETLPLLDTLFDVAGKRKYIKTHPFEALRAARRKQKRREESIRALAKRSYTEAEEARIWEYFQQNRDNGGSLGMLLCFLTGLTPPYVAALTWRDWRRITHTSHTQLVANKKLLPDGTLEWQTEEDNCRLLPLMDVLSEVLTAWKQKNTPEPDDRIVAVDGNPLQAIRKQIRQAETFAGIAPDLISIPDSDKRMDLNQYAGSRMRENFERHCYVDCAMTDAEVHYLILLQMPDTLSRNYADYGHECMQERMSVKLNQWGQRFRESRADDWRMVTLTKQPVTLASAGNHTESYHLTARITDKLTITAECDHDFDYRFLIRSED